MLFPVQFPHGTEDFLAAFRVQHGSGFVQYDAAGPQRQRAGDSNPLLLPAGQQMRRMFPVIQHIHRPQSVFHSLLQFLCGYADIFRPESHVFFHNSRHDLVVRILEHHTRVLPDLPQIVFVQRIQPVNVHTALRR